MYLNFQSLTLRCNRKKIRNVYRFDFYVNIERKIIGIVGRAISIERSIKKRSKDPIPKRRLRALT